MSPIRIEAGPMFSGKSTALGSQIESHKVAGHQLGKEYLAFNHSLDNRYSTSHITVHKGINHESVEYECISISSSQDLISFLFNEESGNLTLKPQFIHLHGLYLDEGQFFDPDLPEALSFIDEVFLNHPDRNEPLTIVVAGLDQDFRGEPFGPMPNLMALASEVHKHTAVCKECGKPNATRTQRIVNGQPAHYLEPTILVGAQESYTAHCEKHHQVPGKPYPNQT